MQINKRDFFIGAGIASVWPASSAIAAPKTGELPALLTVSGAISKTNRGPLDPVIDQMMGKHGIQFSKAHSFDAEARRDKCALGSDINRPAVYFPSAKQNCAQNNPAGSACLSQL